MGHSPFVRAASENPPETEMCERILNNRPDLSKLRLKNGLNILAIEHFIQALLIKDPARRLGRQSRSIFKCKFSVSFGSVCLFLVGVSSLFIPKAPVKAGTRPFNRVNFSGSYNFTL